MMVNMYEHYDKMAAMGIEYEMTYEGDHSEVLYKQTGKAMYSDKMKYVKSGGNITLYIKGEYLAVSHDNKVLIYNTVDLPQSSSQKYSRNEILSFMDSLRTNGNNLTYRFQRLNNKEAVVFIEEKGNPYYSAYSMKFNTSDFRLLEMVYYVKQNDEESALRRIRIRYFNETAHPKFSEPECQFNYYLKKEKGKWIPTSHFQEFQLLDRSKK